MFLSQLLVNMGDDPDKPSPGREWIKQTYRVHQRIWMAFPDTPQREQDPFFLGAWVHESPTKPRRRESGFLFRIEPDLPTRILVQSALRPDWEYAFQNAPYLIESAPQVREFEPTFAVGQRFRFRLTMLMVKRRTKRDDHGRRENGVGSTTEHPIRCFLPGADGDELRPDPLHTAWRERLFRVAERSGFSVDSDRERLRVVPVRSLRMKPTGRGQPLSFNAALFDGVLTCTDGALLADAVVNGLGRGKAFGMGLLSLAVLR